MYSHGKNIPGDERTITKALEENPSQEIQGRSRSGFILLFFSMLLNFKKLTYTHSARRDREEVELGSRSQIVIHAHEALMGQNH